MDEPRALAALAALAQPTRLAAFRRLLTAHPASLQAGEIAQACGVPHNTMSTHLGVLTEAALLRVERDGRTMNYRVDVAGFRGLVLFLTRDCCNGRPDLCGDRRALRDDPKAHRDFHQPAVRDSRPLGAEGAARRDRRRSAARAAALGT